MTATRLHGEFVSTPRGNILVVGRYPISDQGVSVLLVPPFAEEMNKTRRLYADLAQSLARQGVAALLPDLGGTGDSAGDFGTASWPGWVDDLHRTAAFAQERGWPVRGVVAVRLGCQLAADFCRGLGKGLDGSVFWQPVINGEQFLTQFLRLRVAARIMAAERETVSGLRVRLEKEGQLDVAGYALNAGLAAAVASRDVDSCLHASLGRLTVVDVQRADAATGMSRAAGQLLEAAQVVGVEARHASIGGDPFWVSTEIVRNAELVALSAQCLAELGNE